MVETLSIWRSPLDRVSLGAAIVLAEAQPRCVISGEDLSATTIYNYPYYIANSTSDTNEEGLADMFAAIAAANPYGGTGGTAFIPQTNFPINLAVESSFPVPDQCTVFGSGTGGSNSAGSMTSFFHFALSGTGAKTFLSCTGDYTTGGRYFRGLAFRWENADNAEATCILAAAGNCRAVDCTFTNVPLAFNAQGPECWLEQCTIYYASGPKDTKAVILAGLHCGVRGPGAIFQLGVNQNGKKGCTGISVESTADHAVIKEIHLSDWSIGVDFQYSSGVSATELTNCEIQCLVTALNISLENGSGPTTGVKVTSCLLAKSNYSSEYDPTGGAVVLIDPSGKDYDLLSDITLLDCTVVNLDSTADFFVPQHGLEIAGGTNIKVIGGTYSNNGVNGGAGIAITGPCGDIEIVGVNLNPSYPPAGLSANDQQYGVYISSTSTGVILISACDLTGGYAAGDAINVAVPPSKLLVYNCPGYNDLNTPLNSGGSPTTPTSASNCSTPYYGPSIFMFTNPGPVTLYIYGQTLQLSFGVIFLSSPYDEFHFATHPMTFAWLGT